MLDPRRHPFLATLLAAILCIPGWAYGQRPMPLENAVLQTDLNAATFSINNATNVTATGNFIGNLTGNAGTATNASYSTNAGNASFSNTSTNATYATTAGNLTSFPGNLVYTDVTNQTITGNLTIAKSILDNPANELVSSLSVNASGLSYTNSQTNNEYNVTGVQSYGNSLSAQPGLNGVIIASEEYTSDGGVQDYKTTLKVAPYELKLSAQDLQNTVSSNLTLTYSGLVLPQNVSSSTGNLSVNGTNIILDTGDIFLSGGDIINLGNITSTSNAVKLETTGSGISNRGLIINSATLVAGEGNTLTLTHNGTFCGNFYTNSFANCGIRSANSFNTAASNYISGNVTGTGGGSYKMDYQYGTVIADEMSYGIFTASANKTTSSTDNVSIVDATVANITISLTNGSLQSKGAFYYVTNSSNGSITVTGGGGADTINGAASISLPSGGAAMFILNEALSDWKMLVSGAGHAVSSVAGGGNITSAMPFARITSTGNVTVFDGNPGNWLTVKNKSGGTVTLLSADTFDGNSSISLNNNEAVSLTSTGTDWMIH